MRVVFAPEVEEDLYGLIKILVEKEYLGTYPFAIVSTQIRAQK